MTPEITLADPSLLGLPADMAMHTPNSERVCQDVMEKSVASLLVQSGYVRDRLFFLPFLDLTAWSHITFSKL